MGSCQKGIEVILDEFSQVRLGANLNIKTKGDNEKL